MSTPEQRDPHAEDRPATSPGIHPASAPLPSTPTTTTSPTPAPAPAPSAAPTTADADAAPTPPAGDEVPRRDRNRTPATGTFPVPTGPPTTSVGGHLLGILVGLALTLLAIFLVTLGQSRILADGVGRSDITPETLGIVLVTLGALVAGGIILLGLWTPAAPFTGGLTAVLVGAAYLFAPVDAHRQTVRLLSTEQNSTAVLNSITAATTGGLFVLGILLLAAATALSLVRRRGVALGAFRERRSASPAE
ncbi:energy-coupling factor ABC transporter permease [Pengzhenrongella sicca]|uniref:Uncharacterized protein n=1 Tax=Pengzhenrongella sicca TaxID=2819238 RepID=A0A8A4ZCS7_9MICO|nr:energy-coupling factor ABC transporter permease [Pengzhenrongella sicca]QTE29704.1 hypothetical protein J4E96_01215 [Pengzhenrongella sicca]